MNLLDKVERSPLTKEEFRMLRMDLRLRFVLFMLLSVIIALTSIYDHIMVKILMMFLLIILFAFFLKYHLRLKQDISEGVKCTETIQVPDPSQFNNGFKGRFLLLSGAYGHLKLVMRTKENELPMAGENIQVKYLPLSNKVISWKRLV